MRGKAQQVLFIILNINSLISKAEEVYKDDTKIINKNYLILYFYRFFNDFNVFSM